MSRNARKTNTQKKPVYDESDRMSGIVYADNRRRSRSSSRNSSSSSISTTSSDSEHTTTLETHQQKFVHLRSTGKGKKKRLPARLLRHTLLQGMRTPSESPDPTPPAQSENEEEEEEVLVMHRAKRPKLAADAWASFACNNVARIEESSRYGSAEADKENDARTSRRSGQDRSAPLMRTR